MYTLRTSSASPFGRKVKIALHVIGLLPQVQVVPADTNDAGDNLRQQNPLGKIPVLLRDDGMAIYDSRVIIEYLDHLDGRGILIPAGAARFPVLIQQALADGLMDAALLQVYEKRYRPETGHDAKWMAYQQDKVLRALDAFTADLPKQLNDLPHVGEIALASALGYLDLRFEGAWRATHPELVQWLAGFEARVPAFAATRP